MGTKMLGAERAEEGTVERERGEWKSGGARRAGSTSGVAGKNLCSPEPFKRNPRSSGARPG